MRELWHSLVDDQTVFIRFVRGILAAAAIYLQAEGYITPELAALLGGGALFMGAGEKNDGA